MPQPEDVGWLDQSPSRNELQRSVDEMLQDVRNIDVTVSRIDHYLESCDEQLRAVNERMGGLGIGTVETILLAKREVIKQVTHIKWILAALLVVLLWHLF